MRREVDYGDFFATYKGLRLVAREYARSLGIESEGPVFISSLISKQNQCECGARFGPIVYSPERTIQAEHIHPKKGGIYFYEFAFADALKESEATAAYGWNIKVEPQGKYYRGRSEQIKTGPIQAFCMIHEREPLKEGFVAERSEIHSEVLIPVCAAAVSTGSHKAIYRFSINEGQVFFIELQNSPN